MRNISIADNIHDLDSPILRRMGDSNPVRDRSHEAEKDIKDLDRPSTIAEFGS